jgi:hypothetical protein
MNSLIDQESESGEPMGPRADQLSEASEHDQPIEFDPEYREEEGTSKSGKIPKKEKAPRKSRAKKPVAVNLEPTPEEGEKAVKTGKAGAGTMQWSTAVGTYDNQFEAHGKIMPIDKLCIDYKLEHGQARRLNMEHVDQIQQTFQVRPPLGLTSALVWNNGSMYI